MTFYTLNDYGDGCHMYELLTNLADHVGEFFTADEVVELYAENGQTRSAGDLYSYNYVYISGEWDNKHIQTLVNKYKKQVGKSLPSTIVMSAFLSNQWVIPQHIHDAVAVEFLKEFSKKYTRVDNRFFLKVKRPLSDFECVRLISRIASHIIHDQICASTSIRSTNKTIAGLENLVRIKIACGITLEMFTAQLDKTLVDVYTSTHPQLKVYHKQAVDIFKRLAKDKKLIPTTVKQ